LNKPIKSVFVTGVAGFAGSWLAEELLEAGYHVFGAVHPKEPTVHLATIKSDLELMKLDICKGETVAQALKSIKPDYICHLAALASVWRSYKAMQQTFRVNFEGTMNLLEAAHLLGGIRKFLFVSSADCYGVFSPHRLPVTVARSFPHTGPRQSDDFVVPSFAHQIAVIETTRKKPIIKVGNLSARRDFSDVRDIVRGYRRLLQKGKPGRVYHLSSGRTVSIESVLNRLLSLSSRKIKVSVDKARFRPADIPIQRGSNRRAVQELGYGSRYSLNTTLRDTLEYWRQQVHA
jgi:GDP-4-dehydro-6-deoxy-D-mannose reductase